MSKTSFIPSTSTRCFILAIIFFILSLFFLNEGKSQTKDTTKTNQPTQVEINKFIDSLSTKTTIKEFNSWVDESVSAKQAREGKWSELYNLFLQQKYQVWLNNRNKKPK